MTIEIEFVGAAQTVTGSRHLVRTVHSTLLLDCGLFQGRRRLSRERNLDLGVDPTELDAVVLSHAHIDHSGALPVLCKRGFEGSIYTTPATRDLCAVMLADAAMIQQADARHINRQIELGRLDSERVEPLYELDDVEPVLKQMTSLPYHRVQRIAEGIDLTFLDAGHVLGSAITVLDIDDEGQRKRLVFSGDLGRNGMPILRDPELVEGAMALLLESTYGDRSHPDRESMDEELAVAVQRTLGRGGQLLIPSFALERAQEVIYSLNRLRASGRIPRVPVYVDSPLTVNITEIFRLHSECFDSETRALLHQGNSPFQFEGLHYVSTVEDSIALSDNPEPCIIIAASGMCEGGRVLHHLKAVVEDPKSTILIVGFQAEHTLGRRLVERRSRIKVFGVERERNADVVVLNGFSAHADRNDLLAYAKAARDKGPLRHVALVHGEPKAQRALSDALQAAGFLDVRIPAQGDKLTI
ncbi:MAG TPA: MBL fold metallo-hydrolase [Polyangiaceae bacterium]|jgi:metallo-beta-lactamase family protein|nr:MBL fold metallo-hydrolase [Polyangiaceae bacterium]